MKSAKTERTPGGRPPKFKEPSGPVTVTLPKRTLDQLRSIDDDRAIAIVKAVDAAVGSGRGHALQIEVIEVAAGAGVVVIPANRSLHTIPWLKTIEVAPGRYLLTIVSGTSIEKLEIALLDLIENARKLAPDEVPMLDALQEKIRQLRRGEKISKAEILFVAV
jgi:hypothetical protein